MDPRGLPAMTAGDESRGRSLRTWATVHMPGTRRRVALLTALMIPLITLGMTIAAAPASAATSGA